MSSILARVKKCVYVRYLLQMRCGVVHQGMCSSPEQILATKKMRVGQVSVSIAAPERARCSEVFLSRRILGSPDCISGRAAAALHAIESAS